MVKELQTEGLTIQKILPSKMEYIMRFFRLEVNIPAVAAGAVSGGGALFECAGTASPAAGRWFRACGDG